MTLAPVRTADTSQPTETTTPTVDKTPGVSAPKEGTSKLVATYQDSVGHPFVAEHYGITNIWNSKDGGFTSEVSTIEGHIKDLVSKGELDNDTEAATKLLTEMETKAELNESDSTTVKLIKLAAYVRMQQEIKAAMEWKNGRTR